MTVNKLTMERKNIDAVMVATTDHTHAFASLAALRAGKHVYCETPHDIHEVRTMTKAAGESALATQMGRSAWLGCSRVTT